MHLLKHKNQIIKGNMLDSHRAMNVNFLVFDKVRCKIIVDTSKCKLRYVYFNLIESVLDY